MSTNASESHENNSCVDSGVLGKIHSVLDASNRRIVAEGWGQVKAIIGGFWSFDTQRFER
jgi:hypothetical protein